MKRKYLIPIISIVFAIVLLLILSSCNKTNQVEYTLTSNNQVINNGEYADEFVIVKLQVTKEVKKVYLVNKTTNEKKEYTPELIDGKYVLELKVEESSTFELITVDEKNKETKQEDIVVKIDKQYPTFDMDETKKVYHVNSIDVKQKIVNLIKNVNDDSNYKIYYKLNNQNFKEIEIKDKNFEFNKTVTSGIYTLTVKVVDESGKETIKTCVYEISYDLPIIDTLTNKTINFKAVNGEKISYYQALPENNDAYFKGYSIDQKNIIDNNYVLNNNDKVYVMYKPKVTLNVEKPTCNNSTYSGKQINLVNGNDAYKITNNYQTYPGTYEIKVSLNEGYEWTDNTKDDVTLKCSISKNSITVTAESKRKVYDNTELTGSATVTKGNLNGNKIVYDSNSTIIEVGKIENTGTVKVLDKNNNDISKYYNINFVKGTLEVTKNYIKVTTGSSSKEYDNTPLTNSIITLTEGTLGKNQELIFESEVTITNYGSVDNTGTIKILEGTKDVTEFYSINPTYGKLRITKKIPVCTIDSVQELTYPSNKTGSIQVSCTGDGNVVVESNDTDKLIVNSNSSITINTYTGSAILSVYSEETQNYEKAEPVTKEIQLLPSSFNITFDYETNGGYTASVATQSYTYMTDVIKKDNPSATKTNWEFVGWNTESTKKTALKEYLVENNATIYAIFKKAISPTYIYKNGSEKDADTQNIFKENTNKTFETLDSIPSYNGYSLYGWTKDETYSVTARQNAITPGEDVTIKDNENIYAIYKKNQTLKYNTNGGNTISDKTITNYMDYKGNVQLTEITLPTPTKTDYEFDGWYKESSLTNKFGEKITIDSDTTIYAKWKPLKAKINFVTDSTLSITAMDVTTGIAYSNLPIVEKGTSSFNGWYLNNELITTNSIIPYEESITLTAHYNTSQVGKAILTSDNNIHFISTDIELDKNLYTYAGKNISKFYNCRTDNYKNDDGRTPWHEDLNSIIKNAYFEKSFINFKPLSLRFYFYRENSEHDITSISGLENINLSQVDGLVSFMNGQRLIKKIVLPENFKQSTNLKSIDDIFTGCTGLEYVDISNLYTASLTGIWGAFMYCTSLTTFIGDNLDLSKCGTVSSIFVGCTSLKTLDLSDWKFISNNLSIYSMFEDCKNLETLDISNWNIPIAIMFKRNFKNCSKLTSLDLSNIYLLNHSENNFQETFYGCTNLEKIYVNYTWNGIYGTTTSNTFTNCTKLVGGNGKTYSSTDTNSTFANYETGYLTLKETTLANLYTRLNTNEDSFVRSLTSIEFVRNDGSSYSNGYTKYDMSANLDNSIMMYVKDNKAYISSRLQMVAPTDMSNFFKYCASVQSITGLELIDISNTNNLHATFGLCRELTTLSGYENWNTSKVKDYALMFEECKKITSFDFRNWDMTKADTLRGMFNKCNSLEEAKGFVVSELVTTLEYLFNGCNKLSIVDTTNWNVKKVTNYNYMFHDNTLLETIDLSMLDTSLATTMNSMFGYCRNLKTIYVSALWDTSNVTSSTNMFIGCSTNLKGDITWTNDKVTDKTYATYTNGYLTLKSAVLGNIYYKYNTTTDSVMGSVTEINFVRNDGSIYNNGYTKYDLSKNDDKSIMMYIKDNKAYITSIYQMKFDNTATYFFKNLSSLKKITGMELIDTSNTTEFYGMFHYCVSLETISGYENWDTSKVTTVEILFCDCEKLQSIDIRNWDLSNVTKMWAMFNHCYSITSIKGLIVTEKVSSVNCLLNGCRLLTEIDTSKWKVKNSTVYELMFCECQSLTELDLSGFDTTNVTSMNRMFAYCSMLKTIYVSYLWNTNKVTDSIDMFIECHGGLKGDIIWARANPTDKTYATYNDGYLTLKETIISGISRRYNNDTDSIMKSVKTIKFESNDGSNYKNYQSFDVSSDLDKSIMMYIDNNMNAYITSIYKITALRDSLYHCFRNFDELTSVDGLELIDTSKAVSIQSLFEHCSKLVTISGYENWNTSNITDFQLLFSQCNKLEEIDLRNWDFSKAQRMRAMFNLCYVLETVQGLCVPSSVINFDYMFNGCHKLTEIDMSNWGDMHLVTNFSNAFSYCYDLISLDLSNWNINPTKLDNMFIRCTSLTTIIVNYDWDVSGASSSTNMFDGCTLIVGGNGTLYKTNGNNDKEMAVIDSVDHEGYLTVKTNVMKNLSKVKEISSDLSSSIMSLTKVSYEIGDGSDYQVTPIDFSYSNDNSVKLYIVGTEAHIVSDKMMEFPQDSSHYFEYMNSLTRVDGLKEYTTTRNTTNFGYFFQSDQNLVYADVSNFDMRKANNTEYMFGTCRKLQVIDVSNWEFNKDIVINTRFMFRAANAINELDLSKWEIKVSNMSQMFLGLYFVKVLDLSGFDTTYVTNIDNTFSNSSELTTIYVGNKWVLNSAIITNAVLTFNNSPNIIGGNGTHSDGAELSTGHMQENIDLARPDLPGQPGYLTLKVAEVLNLNTFTTNNSIDMSEIKTIKFELNTRYAYDYYELSSDPNKSIKMYLIDDECIITSDYVISFPSNSSNFFKDLKKVENIIFDDSIYTSNVTNMSSMFYDCRALKSLDLSHFNTSNVTDMNSMFVNLQTITSLDVSKFDTSHVTGMYYMFYGCNKLTSLNLSNFVTNEVTNISYMFYDCTSLTSLNVSGFNTSKVTTMAYMFRGLSNLEHLNITNFDTSKVESMYAMFSGMTSLLEIDLTHFNTKKVNTMRSMFYECKSLKELDLRSFDLSSNKSVAQMFITCINLERIYVSNNWNYSLITDDENMFKDCLKLVGQNGTTYNSTKVDSSYGIIDISGTPGYFTDYQTMLKVTYTSNNPNHLSETITLVGYDNMIKLKNYIINTIGDHNNDNTVTENRLLTVKLEGYGYGNANQTFAGCMYATTFDLSSLDTSNITSMSQMFSVCTSATVINISGINTSNVTSMAGMFDECNKVQVLDFSSFDTSKVTSFGSFLCGCSSLTSIDLSSFDTSQATNMNYMFGKTRFSTLDLTSFNTSKVTTMSKMFQNSINLTTIYVSDAWNTSLVTNSENMFYGCTLLTNFNSEVIDVTNAHYNTGGYLTYGFLQKEYLSAIDDQQSYINTGIKVTKKTKLEISYKSETSGGRNIASQFSVNNDNYTLFAFSGYDTWVGNNPGSYHTSFTPIYNEKVDAVINYEIGNSYVTLNGDNVFTNNGVSAYGVDNNNLNPIILFGLYYYDSITCASSTVRIYEAKFTQDDVVVKHFKPVQRISDGELGMYDVINNVFYTNDGSGTFGSN